MGRADAHHRTEADLDFSAAGAHAGEALGCIQLARAGFKPRVHPDVPTRQWRIVESLVPAADRPAAWTREEQAAAVVWAELSYVDGSSAPPPPHVQHYFDAFDAALATPGVRAALARGF